MERKIISHKNLPVRTPLFLSLVAYLYCDLYHAREWVWTIVIAVLSVLWIISIYAKFTEKQIEVFNKEDDKPAFSKFQERMEAYKKSANDKG